jgi:DNA-binding Xre family transcriptional regulator
VYIAGMITTHINEIAQARGIKTAYQLMKKLEISPSMAARLYKDDVKMIDLDTLDRLCRILNTTPAKILRYESEG